MDLMEDCRTGTHSGELRQVTEIVVCVRFEN